MARLALRDRQEVIRPGELTREEAALLQAHRSQSAPCSFGEKRDHTVAKWIIIGVCSLIALAMIFSFAWNMSILNADIARYAIEQNAEIAKAAAATSGSEDKGSNVLVYWFSLAAALALLGLVKK